MPQARGLPRSGAVPAPGQTDTGDRQRHMATHPCSGGRMARWGNPSPAHGSAVLSAVCGS